MQNLRLNEISLYINMLVRIINIMLTSELKLLQVKV
jgi:hypothetical protein